MNRTNIGKRFIDDGVLDRPVPQHIERPLSEAPTLAEDVVQTYINNHRIVLAMGDAYGFEVAFFWQPVLGQANKPRTPEEDALVAEFQSSQLLWEPVYAGVQQAANEWPNLHYIADVFDEQEAYLYSDIVHLTPPANEIVAERMIREIQP